MRLLLLSLVLIWGGGLALAETAVVVPDQKRAERSVETLQGIHVVMGSVEAELETARRQVETAATEEEKNRLNKQIADLIKRLTELEENFKKVALGLEVEEFSDSDEPVFDLGGEVEEVLKPVFREINDATSGLRNLDALRTSLEVAQDRQKQAEGAVRRLEKLIEVTQEDADLLADLESLKSSWEGRAAQAKSGAQSLLFQIEEMQREKVPFLERVSQGFKVFCQTRGRNLLFALVALFGVTFFLRWAYKYVKRLSPWHRRPNKIFWSRLVDVLYAVFSVLAGIIAGFAVLFVTGDWVLLVVWFLLLVGILWASKHTLPLVYEQTKILLNLGPVREKERLVFEGIPWRVDSLGLYCEFKNPALAGGELRLPLRSLVDLHSRPCAEKELWFPTEPQDWVKTSDGLFGRVVSQTPEQVELVKLGGSRVIFPASTFLEMAPENLSKNFRISVDFGIDYDHQPKSTEEIPQLFYNTLFKELVSAVKQENLLNLKVEFKQAAASSLDYEILADFSGEVASRYNVLTRLISKVCVDVCNEHGFVIPFTQVTIHQAATTDE